MIRLERERKTLRLHHLGFVFFILKLRNQNALNVQQLNNIALFFSLSLPYLFLYKTCIEYYTFNIVGNKKNAI